MNTEVTFADLMAKKKPQMRRVKLPLESSLLIELEEARAAVKRWERLGAAGLITEEQADEVADDEERLANAEAAMENNSVEFVFQAIGREEFEELVAANPPTAQQKNKIRDEMKRQGMPRSQQIGPQWNIETFPPKLIAATCTSPEMTEAQSLELWASTQFNQAELEMLFSAALGVQTSVSQL